ncbi:VCBS domain-containing protein [Vibrio parahaemolyticus]
MGVAALLGLSNVTGSLVLDSKGKLIVLPEGVAPRPGDVFLSHVDKEPSDQLDGVELAQLNVQPSGVSSESGFDDQDAADIIAQIEAGEDPTQDEDKASAAGSAISSSISDAATVEAMDPQVLAATFFETTGLDPRSLNDAQTNTLRDIFSNAAPVTVFELRSYDEESQDSELNLDFPIDPNGDVLTLTVTEIPKLGTLTLADGTPVTVGQLLMQAEFEGLQFDAPMEYTAGKDAGQFTFTVDDGRGEINSVQSGGVAITINPINDIPVIVEPREGSVTESGHFDNGDIDAGNDTATGQVVATDNDTDSVLAYSIANQSDQYGSISIDSKTGEWTYTLNNTSTATQALAEGQTATSEYTVLVTDDKGAIVTDTIVITITGTNDKPELSTSSHFSGQVVEAGNLDDGTQVAGQSIVSGMLVASDVDADSVLAFSAEGSSNYGSFAINPVTGQWTFTLDNSSSATQALQEGQSEDEVFTVKVTDDKGAVIEQAVTITITGTNDQPTFNASSQLVGAVTEAGHDDAGYPQAGTPTATGTLVAEDVDADAQLKFAVDNGDSPYGKLVVKESGQWVFTLDNTTTETQALKEGETKDVSFTVKVTDEFGAVNTETVTITLTGTNDVPAIAGNSVTAGAVKEAGHEDDGTVVSGTPSATGTIEASDVDADSVLAFSAESSSNYGSFAINPVTGQWTFTLDNSSSATQALQEGQSEDVIFMVKVTDDKGAVIEQAVTITITGTNDQPTFDVSSQLVGAVTEAGHDDAGYPQAGTPTATGMLVAEDVDADAQLKIAVDNGDSPYGKLVVQESGQWIFTLDNTTTETQALKEGETKDVSFTVKVTDEFGAVNTETVTITLTGTNDVPAIAGNSVTAGAVKEAGHEDDGTVVSGTPSATGTIEASDVDADSVLAFSAEGSSNYGSFAINPVTGQWTFTLDNSSSATQALQEGQSEDVIFMVKVTDDKGAVIEQAVTITITGTNDQPTFDVSSKLVGAVTEAGHDDAGNVISGTPIATGMLVAEDVDADAQLKIAVDKGDSPYGKLVVQESGQWIFTLDNTTTETQALKEGETKDVSFTVKVIDEFGAVSAETVTITITGTNDQPTFTSSSTLAATVTEAGHTDSGATVPGTDVATGTLVGTDVDADSTLTYYIENGNSDYGNMVVLPDGGWTFTLNNDSEQTQALKEGQTKDINFTVTVRDEHGAINTEVVTISIKGTNDKPTFVDSSELSGNVVESGHLDNGTAVPGTPSASGQLHAEDIDADANLTFSVENGATGYGNLVVQPNGQWTFVLDNNSSLTQALRENETKELSFTVKVTDEFGATDTEVVKITITGTNDKPTITQSSDLFGDVKEAGHQEDGTPVTGTAEVEGTLIGADVDAGSSLTFSIDDGSSDYGTLVVDDEGDWKFTLDNTSSQVQSLNEGQSHDVTFTVKVRDELGAINTETVTITVKGTNDQPTFTSSSVLNGAVTEAGHLGDGTVVAGVAVAAGTLTATDVDADAQLKFSVDSGSNDYGELVVQENGQWKFTLDNNSAHTQALRENETKELSFTVKVTDEFGAVNTEVVKINITGTNDQPQITSASNLTGTVIEAGNNDDGTIVSGVTQATGTLVGFDADAGSNLTYYVNDGSSDYGNLVVLPDGQWTFRLDNNSPETQALKEGQTQDIHFTVTVRDELGALNTEVITISVKGTNDQPTFTSASDLSGSVVEAGNLDDGTFVAGTRIATGTLHGTDIDAEAQLTFSVDNGSTPYGNLVVQPDGEWRFTLNNRSSATQALREGETKELSFNVKVTDEFGAVSTEVVTIDITGTNDAPNIKFTGNKNLVEDGVESRSGDLRDRDPDANDDHAWEITDSNGGVGEYGTLTIFENANGVTKWRYDLEASSAQSGKVQALAHGEVVTETFTIKVTDEFGAVNEKTITLNITGTNDQPVINGDFVGSVTEDDFPNNDPSQPIKFVGQLDPGDVDTNDTHSWSLNTGKGQFGTISIDPVTGEWTYTLNNSNPSVQALRPGDTPLTETFTVTVKDSSGQSNGSDTQTITINISGTNDAPELAGTTTGSVIEDTPGREVATGNLAVSDIDSTDTHSWQVQGENPVNGKAMGTYGQLSVDDNGQWTYQLDSNLLATRSIPPGMTVTDSFEVIVTDAGGLSDTITVTVSVAGTNTEPEIVVQPQYTVIEDGASLTGTIVSGMPTTEQLNNHVIGAGDPDMGEVISWSIIQNGQYGTFSLDESSGTWSYVLNNRHPDVDALDKCDRLPGGDTVTLRVTDKYGIESVQQIQINIEGANDAPVIGGATTQTIFENAIEAGQYTASGQLEHGDVDADDIHQWTLTDANQGRGDYGTLIMGSDGRWTFTYDQPNKLAQINALKPGEVLTDTFEITVTDHHGASSKESVTIRIEGQNDAPTVSGDISGRFVEDNGTNDPSDDMTPVTGQAVLTDVDNDDFAQFVIAEGQTHNVYTGQRGDLSIDKDGNWQFTPKNHLLQSLAEGETQTEVFTVIAQDQNGATITQDITITIEGRNDVPVIYGESTGTVVEDGTSDVYGVDLSRTDGQLVATDVDNNSSIKAWSIETTGNGTYGTLTLDNSGKWTYVLDNSKAATQALESGETAQETFYVVATDNDGGVSNRQKITVNVIGQADGLEAGQSHGNGNGNGNGNGHQHHKHPHILDSVTTDVKEDGKLEGEGQQLPAGYREIIAESGGLYGQLIEDPDNPGHWIYQLDNDSLLTQGLDEGQTATEVWRIVVPREVTHPGQGGGHAHGRPDRETVDDYVEVTVTIRGTADKPEITYETDTSQPQNDTILLGTAQEDVTTSLSGMLGVEDADLGDTHQWAIDGNSEGAYGTLSIDPDTGEWTYILDPNVELPAGKEVFDTFFVTVTDTDPNEDPSTASDRREVKVQIVGTAEDADNPNVGDAKIVVETFSVDEDHGETSQKGTGDASIEITSQDAGGSLQLDSNLGLGDQITWTLVDGSGTYGSIVVNQDGSWVFTLDNDSQAVQSLQVGETRQDVFEVYAVDQYGKTLVDDNGFPQTLDIVVNVHGQNDAPSLRANIEKTMVVDDIEQTLSGRLTVTDVDVEDRGHHIWSIAENSVNADYGKLTFHTNGTWSYEVDPTHPDIIALGANETIDQIWNVTVTDPKGESATQTLTIHIQGENQPPTMSTDNGRVTEDVMSGAQVSVTKSVVLDDVDSNDVVTLTPIDLDGTYGRFVVDPTTSTWSYVLYNDQPHVQALGEGVTVTEQFTVRATDKFGAEVTQTVDVTVTGSNDQPTLSGSASGSVSDSLGSTAAGKVTVSDVDLGDTHTFSVKQDSNFGTFTVDNNGNWKFVVDENNAEMNALAKGQTKTIQVSVVATDSSGVTATQESNEYVINITIVGTNDAPQIVDIGEQMATENTTTQLTGNFDSGDVDTVNVADSHHWQVASGDPRGELTVDPVTGAWTFNLTGDFEYLSEGETLSSPLSYQVKVTDEHGASDTITVHFQVTGTNDAPTIVASNTVVTGTVHEDPVGAESGTANGVVTIADVDHNDTHSYSLSNSGMVTEIQGMYGTLKLIAGATPESVKWEYVLDQGKADSLNDGPVTENFDLFVESLVGGVVQGDAIKQTIEVTVEGRNDAATVAPESQTVAETDAPLLMSGNLNSTDVDNPDDTFTVQNNKQGTYGTFSIDANGEWTFVANQAFNSLNVGQSVEETFAVTTVDGTLSTVKVTIQGTNDAPSITGDFAQGVQEGVTDSVSGTLIINDVDSAVVTRSLRNGTLSGETYTAMGHYGTLTFNVVTGVWAYVLLAGSSNALAANQTEIDTFYIEASDGATGGTSVQPITITVTGYQGLRGDSALDDILTATADDEWLFGNSIPDGGGISVDNNSQDSFRWETANLTGTDTIKDFDVRDFAATDPAVKYDVVDLTLVDFRADQLLTDQLSVHEQSGHTVIEISDSGTVLQSIVLEGVTLTSLLGVSQLEVDSMTPTEVILALHQSEQLTLPDQIRVGSSTDDVLMGTDESDLIHGGGGHDILTGGHGHDLFIFTEEAAGTTLEPAQQTVTDFHIGDDLLDISDLLPKHNDLTDLLGNITVTVNDDPHTHADSATTVISVTNNGEQTDITLQGIGWNELGISDVSVINDPSHHQSELLNQLDMMHVIKVDP